MGLVTQWVEQRVTSMFNTKLKSDTVRFHKEYRWVL